MNSKLLNWPKPSPNLRFCGICGIRKAQHPLQLVQFFQGSKNGLVVDWPGDTTTIVVTIVNLPHFHMKFSYYSL